MAIVQIAVSNPTTADVTINAKVAKAGKVTVLGLDDATTEAEQFLAALTLVREATSFGGVHSNAERRARWGGDAVGEGFIRFSVGCEAADDLLADVDAALRATAARP